MLPQIAELNKLSLLAFKNLFASLQPPARLALRGVYKGIFVGPGWVRSLSGPLLVLTRMGDWRGKDFDLQGNAVNLVLHRGQIERRLPMQLVQEASLIDHQPGLALHYAPSNPFPWPWIVDELRNLDQGLVLGMTLLRAGPLRSLALPFVLQAQENLDGL